MRYLLALVSFWFILWCIVATVCAAAYLRAYIAGLIRPKIRTS